MKAIDKVIDQVPTAGNISKMVADDERNRLAFLELAHFEKTGRFLYKHPILKKEKLTNELEQLRKSNPDKFTSDLVNASKNITRYTSQINNYKYKNEEEKIKWLNHIRDLNMKLEIMRELLSK